MHHIPRPHDIQIFKWIYWKSLIWFFSLALFLLLPKQINTPWISPIQYKYLILIPANGNIKSQEFAYRRSERDARIPLGNTVRPTTLRALPPDNFHKLVDIVLFLAPLAWMSARQKNNIKLENVKSPRSDECRHSDVDWEGATRAKASAVSASI